MTTDEVGHSFVKVGSAPADVDCAAAIVVLLTFGKSELIIASIADASEDSDANIVGSVSSSSVSVGQSSKEALYPGAGVTEIAVAEDVTEHPTLEPHCVVDDDPSAKVVHTLDVAVSHSVSESGSPAPPAPETAPPGGQKRHGPSQKRRQGVPQKAKQVGLGGPITQ